MKLGDLVRPVDSSGTSNVPIVQDEWVGIIIGFSRDFYGPRRMTSWTGDYPVVYWNNKFNSEIEDPNQIEVIS